MLVLIIFGVPVLWFAGASDLSISWNVQPGFRVDRFLAPIEKVVAFDKYVFDMFYYSQKSYIREKQECNLDNWFSRREDLLSAMAFHSNDSNSILMYRVYSCNGKNIVLYGRDAEIPESEPVYSDIVEPDESRLRIARDNANSKYRFMYDCLIEEQMSQKLAESMRDSTISSIVLTAVSYCPMEHKSGYVAVIKDTSAEWASYAGRLCRGRYFQVLPCPWALVSFPKREGK
jgi:hypothetical protein